MNTRESMMDMFEFHFDQGRLGEMNLGRTCCAREGLRIGNDRTGFVSLVKGDVFRRHFKVVGSLLRLSAWIQGISTPVFLFLTRRLS